MSKAKNCLSCKWEPEWYGEGLANTEGQPYQLGLCRFPVPYWLISCRQNLLSSDYLPNCPAHQPKEGVCS
jgi:hypothetical protein